MAPTNQNPQKIQEVEAPTLFSTDGTVCPIQYYHCLRRQSSSAAALLLFIIIKEEEEPAYKHDEEIRRRETNSSHAMHLIGDGSPDCHAATEDPPPVICF